MRPGWCQRLSRAGVLGGSDPVSQTGCCRWPARAIDPGHSPGGSSVVRWVEPCLRGTDRRWCSEKPIALGWDTTARVGGTILTRGQRVALWLAWTAGDWLATTAAGWQVVFESPRVPCQRDLLFGACAETCFSLIECQMSWPVQYIRVGG